jgi:hypothetical protein
MCLLARAANPGSVVLLSTRESSAKWWESMERTIVPRLDQPVPEDEPETARRREMIKALLGQRFTPGWRDRDAAIGAYEAHNEAVRRGVPADRLIDWEPSDGWEPICSGLGVPVPDEPFPHLNTTAEFTSSPGAAAGD